MGNGIERIRRSRSSLATEVYDQLVDALLQGTLVPGDRLIQDRLAEELDVSRTPVRDALLRLHEEGTIEFTGRRGYVVRKLSPSDLHGLYDARCALEGHAAATISGDEEAIATIRIVLEATSAAPPTTTRTAFEANRAIHRAIVAAAGNPHLLGFFDTIWGRAVAGLAYHDFSVAPPGPYEDFLEAHERLLDEIARGTPEQARVAAVDHISHGLDRTLDAQRRIG
jgi:DNA-binding GntR family transcriptional regulator